MRITFETQTEPFFCRRSDSGNLNTAFDWHLDIHVVLLNKSTIIDWFGSSDSHAKWVRKGNICYRLFFGKQVKPTSTRCFLGHANGPLHQKSVTSILNLRLNKESDDFKTSSTVTMICLLSLADKVPETLRSNKNNEYLHPSDVCHQRWKGREIPLPPHSKCLKLDESIGEVMHSQYSMNHGL